MITLLGVASNNLIDSEIVSVSITETITGHTYTNCKTNIEIPGWVQGTPYFVRAYAYNALGYGLATHASGGSLKPLKIPGAPTAVTLSVVSGTALRLVWSPPTDDGGDTITSYQVEWDTLSNFSSANAAAHTVLYLSGVLPLCTQSQAYLWGSCTARVSSQHRRIWPHKPTLPRRRITHGSFRRRRLSSGWCHIQLKAHCVVCRSTLGWWRSDHQV